MHLRKRKSSEDKLFLPEAIMAILVEVVRPIVIAITTIIKLVNETGVASVTRFHLHWFHHVVTLSIPTTL